MEASDDSKRLFCKICKYVWIPSKDSITAHCPRCFSIENVPYSTIVEKRKLGVMKRAKEGRRLQTKIGAKWKAHQRKRHARTMST